MKTAPAAPKPVLKPRRIDDTEALVKMALEGNTRRANVQAFSYAIAPTAYTANQNRQLTIPTFTDSYFVVKRLAAISTSTFTTRIYNGSTGRVYSDVRVNNANIWGTIQLPNVLLDPMVLPPNSNVLLDLTDSSGSTNTIQCVLVGYRWFDLSKPPVFGRRGVRLEWFQYSAVPDAAIAGNGKTIVQTRVDADSDFILRKLIATSTGTFQAQISDSGSKDVWMDQYIRNANLFGTTQYPNVLPKPRLIRRNSTIQTEIEDVSGSSNTVQIIYEGAKILR